MKQLTLFLTTCAILPLFLLAGCKEIEPEPVAVTGVSLNKTTLALTEGETATLTATVSPSDAANKAVSWSSSNATVAAVDNNGTVTAAGAGSATITVRTDDGGKTATCAVTVAAAVVPVTGISLDITDKELLVGETQQLTATVEPADATDKTVSWSTSSAAVATVAEGLVTAVGKGTATIKATAGGKEASCTITVLSIVPEIVDLGLSVKWADRNLGATDPNGNGNFYAWGETQPKQDYSWETYKWYNGSTITKYDNADNDPLLLAEDDAASVALGDQWRLPLSEEFNELITQCEWVKTDNGFVVKGPNGNEIHMPLPGYIEGSTLSDQNNGGFYWTLNNMGAYMGYFYTYDLNNTKYGRIASKYYGFSIRPVYGELTHPTAVKLNKTEATRYAGGIVDLKAVVTPEEAANKAVRWTSSNESVATVDALGRVTVLAEGQADITVTTVDGGLTAQCKLNVDPIPSRAVFSANDFNNSTDDEPLLILQQDWTSGFVYIYKASGTIDLNGHTIRYLYMQNDDRNKIVGLKTGIISDRLDGDAGWYRYTGQTFHGNVALDDMEVPKEFYTDGHVYTIYSGYYGNVCTFRVGDALGDVYIYGGSFGPNFDTNPDAGSSQGDIYLFGGVFAIDPRTYTNAGTTNPRGHTNFIIPEGYSVKENSGEDKDQFPYMVSAD